MRKIFKLLVALSLVLTLVACGKDKKEDENVLKVVL